MEKNRTRFSIIIPVYNRPDELKELLESLVLLPENPATLSSSARDVSKELDWEVIVVEDGSEIQSDKVCSHFSESLDLQYLYQDNAGPALARNTGARSARGEWLIFFDSDCIIPEGYFDAVRAATSDDNLDFFGGPDRAATSFSPVQRAIDYAMTSFITTGGIRGGPRKLDRYYPRTFNMGVRKKAFDHIGGFSPLRFGEDLDLSMRLMAAGYHSILIDQAWVYHKRRTDLKKFFKQVYNSGMARIVLNKLHPGTIKPLHLLPSFFVIYLLLAVLSIPFLYGWMWIPPVILILLLFADGLRTTRSLKASLIIPSAGVVQLIGYGLGLIHAFFLIHILGRDRAGAFERTFYK